MNDAVYQKIFEDYHDKVFSYINARIRRYHDAEDITSDVFVKVMAAYDSFDSTKASLSTWIYTIANNTMRDYLRRFSTQSKRSCDVEDDFLENLLSEPDEGYEKLYREELCETLADALEMLPERERLIVVMHYYDGIPHKEIAQQLQLSYSNVRFICHKAINSIRVLFTQREMI